MKKNILLITILATSLSFGQNTFPVDGNVGIGTTSPTAKQEIYLKSGGGNAFRLNTNFSGGNPVDINPYITGVNNGGFEISIAGSQRFIINPIGNVGIGTTNPTSKLELSVGYANSIVNAFTLKNTFDGAGSVGTGIFFTGYYKHALISACGNPQTRQGGKLQFQTYDNDAVLNTGIVLNEVGNVGIGTTVPIERLSVNGGIGDGIAFDTKVALTRTSSTGNVEAAKIVLDDADTNFGNLVFRVKTTASSAEMDNYYSDALTIKGSNANIGIGTSTPDEKLTVKGKIHTQEVRVDMAGDLVPDYVFATDYKLKTLQEVEDFIKKNNHLPEIPSAVAFEKNGLLLAEMNMSLLKKMEEATLYIIQQDKEIKAQSGEIEMLKKEMQVLKKENESFKTLSERFSKIESQLKTIK